VHEDCTLEVSQEFKDLCQLFRENQITLDVLFNLMSIDMFNSFKPIKYKMLSPKRQAVICHKIAALSYLLAEALDELNPEVADSNPFQCDAMAGSAMKLSVMSLEYKK
jgi:hypothetical protein